MLFKNLVMLFKNLMLFKYLVASFILSLQIFFLSLYVMYKILPFNSLIITPGMKFVILFFATTIFLSASLTVLLYTIHSIFIKFSVILWLKKHDNINIFSNYEDAKESFYRYKDRIKRHKANEKIYIKRHNEWSYIKKLVVK